MEERFFVHTRGFRDGSLYVILINNIKSTIVKRDGSRNPGGGIDLVFCLRAVDNGDWKEVTKEEAEGMLPAKKVKKVSVEYEIGDRFLSSTYINSVMKVEPSGILVVEELGGNKQKYTFAPGVWIKTIEYES